MMKVSRALSGVVDGPGSVVARRKGTTVHRGQTHAVETGKAMIGAR